MERLLEPVKEKEKFENWFDVNNTSHLIALKERMETGKWPKFFIPADVDMEQVAIENTYKKIAVLWIQQRTQTQTRKGKCETIPLEFGGQKTVYREIPAAHRSQEDEPRMMGHNA